MRAAAPYQSLRSAKALANPAARGAGLRFFVDAADVRIKRMKRKAGQLVIFVVDASGSMALNRMETAKGAALSLLAEAYRSRDRIALIALQNETAEVPVPPTRSITLTQRRLARMTCGCGTPLAHGLAKAMRTGLNAQRMGEVGEVVIVCFGDFRVNIPLAVSPRTEKYSPNCKSNRTAVKAELLQIAKKLGSAAGFDVLVVDTESRYVSTGFGEEIANAARGRYHKLPLSKPSGAAFGSYLSRAKAGGSYLSPPKGDSSYLSRPEA